MVYANYLLSLTKQRTGQYLYALPVIWALYENDQGFKWQLLITIE